MLLNTGRAPSIKSEWTDFPVGFPPPCHLPDFWSISPTFRRQLSDSVTLAGVHMWHHRHVTVSNIQHISQWQSADADNSMTEPFRSPQLASGTVRHSMSRLRHHCLSSTAVWKHISLCAAFLDCNCHSYCCAKEVIPSLSDTSVVLVTDLPTRLSFLLLTDLLTSSVKQPHNVTCL